MSVDRSHAQTGVPGTASSITSSDTVQSYDARQLELIRVREAAQRARASAQQAAMARSAERALEEQHLQGNVERSMEVKQLKAQAAQDARSQTAPGAYRGVSSSDIQSWDGGNTGPVTVRPTVPQQFTDTLPAEEEEKKSKGFMGGVLSWRPGFVGKKKREERRRAETNPELPTFAPAETLGLESAPPPPVAPVAKEKKGGLKIPLIGGLFRGSDDKEEEVAADPYFAPPSAAPASAPAYTAAPPSVPASTSAGQQPLVPAPDPFPGSDSAYAAAPPQEVEEDKKGFFGRLNPFSKNDDDVDAMLAAPPLDSPYYANTDAPLLPAPAASTDDQQASSGLFGPVGAPNEGAPMAYSDVDEDQPGFFGRLFGGGDDDNSAPAPSPASSSSGGGVYVVESKGAQLLKFGNSTLNSDSLPMPPGTVVRMTKAGDEWSSVQLPSGAEGIMRNKTLRPAAAGEGSPAMFAHLDKPRYPTTARIGQARSATGATSTSQAPVVAPTPDLPSSGGGASTGPAANSLLPPLPTSAVE